MLNTLVGVESNLENVDKEGDMEEEGMEVSERNKGEKGGRSDKKRAVKNLTETRIQCSENVIKVVRSIERS